MRRGFLVLVFFFAIIGSSFHFSAAPPTKALPIPPGFDWPSPASQLVQWANTVNMPKMREHAWSLWAGINQPAGGGKVVWQTWWPVHDTMHLADANAPKGTLNAINMAHVKGGLRATAANANQFIDGNCADPEHLKKKPCYGNPNLKNPCQGLCVDANGNPQDGHTYANNGDIMIAGEYYDQEAYDHIQANKLWSAKALQPPPGVAFSSIPQFPSRAIVLKYMGWPAQGNGLTALPVFDGLANQYWDYNGYETWKRGVAIDTRPGPIKPGTKATVTYLFRVGGFGPITFKDANVVPVSAFYNHRVDKAEWNAMNPGDKCILNQSAQWTYNRNFQPGDYIVTVAMHIVTKEMPTWAMQTFWWHDKPNDGPYAQNRPKNLPAGTWQHYLMTTAWSMVTPKQPDGTPYIAMNPYIELVVPEKCRATTNCQNCHTRGAYPTVATATNGAKYDTQVRGQINNNDPIFRGLRWTDFQWAVPDRAH